MLHHASRYSIMCHAMICIMYFDLRGVITFMTSRVNAMFVLRLSYRFDVWSNFVPSLFPCVRHVSCMECLDDTLWFGLILSYLRTLCNEFQLILNSIQVVDYQFVTRRVISIVKVSAEPIPRTKHNRDHEEKSDTKLCCIVCCLPRLGEGLCKFY